MKQKYFELLRRKQMGLISPSEDQELRQWKQADKENQSNANAMEQIWQLSEQFGSEIQPNTERALGRLLNRIKEEQQESETISPANIRPLRRQLSWIAVAACLLLAVGFGWQIWSNSASAPQWAVINTQMEDARSIQLEDGTKVWVNKQSTLNFPQNIASADRTLSLFGEAYFEVAPQKDRPFVIELNGAKVEVLGTAFNVRSYPNRPEIEVTVSHGKVRFTSFETQQSWELTANDQIVFNRQSAKEELRKDVNLWALAWQTKELIFDRTPLSSVLPVMERYYDISITLDNPQIANCNFTASFKEESADQVLAVLARSFDLELQNPSDGQYLLRGGNSCE